MSNHSFKNWKKNFLNNKHFIFSSIVFLLLAAFLVYLAGLYLSQTQGVIASDLILDHLPTLNLDFLFIYGILIILFFFFMYPLLFRVKEFHRVVSQFSLLMIIRAVFITFTHLEIPTGTLKFSVPKLLFFLSTNNDLFFSGHVAVPFLGFLLFKDSKIKYYFLASSIIMAFVVLLMHVHYSIDVFGAFFITYGSFKIGEWFFKEKKTK